MSEAPLRPGARYALRHTTRGVRATVRSIDARVDMHTLEEQADPPELALNDIGRVTLRTSGPVSADAYARNRTVGAFILVDEHDRETVAAGMVIDARAEAVPRKPGRGETGATAWLTGPYAAVAHLARLLADTGSVTATAPDAPAAADEAVAVELRVGTPPGGDPRGRDRPLPWVFLSPSARSPASWTRRAAAGVPSPPPR